MTTHKQDTLIIGGKVVLGNDIIETDIWIRGDKIAALGHFPSHAYGDARVIDASGLIVLPGAIDAHCHIALDTGVFATQDDWFIGTREAAFGGITTVIDFVGPTPGQALHDALLARLAQAQEACIDYTFHMTALDAKPQTLQAIAQCPSWGISSLKIYTTYRPNYYLDDEAILAILQVAAQNGLITLIHCENDAIVTAEKTRHEAHAPWRCYPDMRPAIAETEAAQRMLRLAAYAKAKVVIAHNSCAETARLVSAARREGQAVYNETCPQYLYLRQEDNYTSPEPWRFILQPPLRTQTDNDDLQSAVQNGDVSCLVTDHCAYTRAQKRHDPQNSPGGLPGLETLLPLTAAVPGITWPQIARLLAESPAKIYGLWPHKGALLPGFDADILLIKDECYTLNENALHGFAGYSPFHGKQARGKIVHVMRRGETILEDGKFSASPGSGRFLHATL